MESSHPDAPCQTVEIAPQRLSLRGPHSGHRRALVLSLMLLAWLGNSHPVELLFGLDLIFGTVSALLAGALFGPWVGTATAAVGALPTVALWHHPWGVLLLTLEVAFVSTLRWRRPIPMVLLDALFWCAVGAPLLFALASGPMHLSPGSASLLAVKNLVNGMQNAALASLLASFLPLHRWTGRPRQVFSVTLPGVVLNFAVVAVLVPVLLLLASENQRSWSEARREAADLQEMRSMSIASSLENWLDSGQKALDALASRPPREPREIQTAAAVLQRTLPNIQGLFWEEPAGKLVPLLPVPDRGGSVQVDIDLAGLLTEGRPELPRLLWTPGGLGSRTEPLLLLSSQETGQGRVLGTLGLGNLAGRLRRASPRPFETITLVDGQARVLVSTSPYRPPFSRFDLSGHTPADNLQQGAYWIHRHSPDGLRELGATTLMRIQALAPHPGLTLVLETDLAPVQERIRSNFTQSLVTSLGFSLIAVVAVWLLGAWVAQPVGRLVAASNDLPARIESGRLPPASISPIWEFEVLSRTFDDMARELRARFQAQAEQNQELARVNQVLLEEKSQRQALEEQMRQTQKMEALGLFAGGVAHDFNNLLAAILGSAEVSVTGLPPDHPAREGLDQIRASALQARNLVHQILTFSNPSPRSGQPMALRPAVREVCGLVRSALPASIDFQVRLAEEVGLVDFTPGDLARVLINLTSNAENALRTQGGGTLCIELDQVDLDPEQAERLQVESAAPFARLQVSDSGPGIPPEVVPHLFEPFFTTRSHGTGLGLPVVREIVRGHGGAVEILSPAGQGACAQVFLPIVGEAPSPTPSEACAHPPGDPPGGTERVLFVDDELPLVRLGRLTLQQLGYQVEVFQDPLQALERFRQDPEAWDLLISDHSMPGMSGTRLVREMRALNPGLPVLICTGLGQEDCQEEARELGLQEVLLKPVPIPELALAIRRVLERPV
jgi:signal transduction histidine kinase